MLKNVIFSCVVFFFLISCKKHEETISSFSEARYTIQLSGKWNNMDFGFPQGAHFTNFVGMVHDDKTHLWKDGGLSTPGIEAMAESGNGGPLLLEIDSSVAAKNALGLVVFLPPTTTGTTSVNLYCNSNYPAISFMSMLGPTPDWFTGVNSFQLFHNRTWINDTTIQLYVYDAGTEEGSTFSYDNPPTFPQQNISLLSASGAMILANGSNPLKPIATARFIKQ